MLLYAVPITVVLAVLVMLFIRCTGKCFIYILLFVAIAGCLALGIMLVTSPSIQFFENENMDKVFTIVLGALLILFGVVLIIGLICYRKRIRLASIIV